MKRVASLVIGLSTLAGGEVLAQDLPARNLPAGDAMPRAEMALAGLGNPVMLERSARFDVEGTMGTLRVLVSAPDVPPPPSGYGVIYAIDAGWTFGTLRDALRLQGGESPPGATVVVALGWPAPDLIDMTRRGPDLVGANAAATLALLTDTIVPRVEAALPVDPAHRMILGHSFGGAFALRAGLTRPDLFSHVAAGSPSIWTDPEWFLNAPLPAIRPKVLITLGALEFPEAAAAVGTDPARLERLRTRDMAGRAEAMAARFGTRTAILGGASHGSSVPAFLGLAAGVLWR